MVHLYTLKKFTPASKAIRVTPTLYSLDRNPKISPLSKRVETWCDIARAHDYDIVWGRTRISF